MPYDPTLPADHSVAEASELRLQFNGLKALIDALAQQIEPIGTVKAWVKDFPNTPPLGANWVECNGQPISDPASPYDGQLAPDLNGNGLFLRGSSTSGSVGGQDTFGTAAADNSGSGSPFSAVTTDFSPGATPIPPYYTVVWIIRVK